MTKPTAVITGSGSGIGAALAAKAANDGYHVILVGRRKHQLEQTRLMIGPDNATVVAADITTEEGRAKIAVAAGNRLNLLINNAGVIDVGPTQNAATATTEKLIATNLTAPICLTSQLLPALLKSGGQVVNIGSVFGDIAHPYFVSYSASKFGLRGYSDALRREVSCDGIAVTYVAPRATSTPAEAAFGQLVGPMAMTLDSPAYVAEFAWTGIQRRKRSIYPPSKERFFVALQRIAPRLIDRALAPLSRNPVIKSIFDNSKKEAL